MKKSPDNPNFWRTHIAAMATGAILSVGFMTCNGLDTTKQEDEIATVRKALDACLSEKQALADELAAIKAHRKNDFETVRRLRDENARMSIWMDWLLGQEKELMEEQERVTACIDSESRPAQEVALPEEVKLSDEGRQRMNDLLQKGCKIDSIMEGRIRFERQVMCEYEVVALEEDPGRDYIDRDAFHRDLTDQEEAVVSAFEQRKYSEVFDMISTDEFSGEMEKRLENIELHESVQQALRDFVAALGWYRSDPGNPEAKCALVKAYSALEHLPGLKKSFFEGQVFMSFLLQAMEEGGVNITHEEAMACHE